MSQPIVLQLQELASDSSQDVSDLLRKTLLVATKLKLNEFRQWAMSELNGYEIKTELPAYRTLKGDLRAHNPIHGLVPFLIEDPELAAQVRKRGIFESISSIVQTIESPQQGQVVYTFSPEAEAALMRMQTSLVPLRPMLVVGRNQLAAIVEAIRTKVLDWALTLEAEGIRGDGLSFSARERDIAMAQNIRIDNFQGVLGNVGHGGQVQQNNTLTVVRSDFGSLATYLDAQGVSKADIGELNEAISSDPAPSSPQTFGPRVSTWIGKMLTKAADGTWKVGIATAGTVLAAALNKFHGLGD